MMRFPVFNSTDALPAAKPLARPFAPTIEYDGKRMDVPFLSCSIVQILWDKLESLCLFGMVVQDVEAGAATCTLYVVPIDYVVELATSPDLLSMKGFSGMCLEFYPDKPLPKRRMALQSILDCLRELDQN